MKRESYSQHFVPSVLRQKAVLVSDVLTSLLITWAETTPGVKHIELGSPRFSYDDDGKPSETAVALSGVMTDGASFYWDTEWNRPSGTPSKSQAVKSAHARHGGARYQVFSAATFNANRIELKNRQSAHRLLFQGRDRNTDDLETRMLLALGNPTNVQRLAEDFELPITLVLLAGIRLFLKGRATVPMATQLMCPRWSMEKRELS